MYSLNFLKTKKARHYWPQVITTSSDLRQLAEDSKHLFPLEPKQPS